MPLDPGPTGPPPLPVLHDQVRRLEGLGVLAMAGLQADELLASCLPAGGVAPLLVVDPALAPPSALAPLLRRGDRPGFVVADMTDVDDFAPVTGLVPPPGPAWLVHDLDRGDALANQSPDEAAPVLAEDGRPPLLLVEGMHWLLQVPEALERNRCFMTTGSRRRKADGRLDARTPALWISGGTGRDGRERRGAPKVGWCWAGNRHTWLGIASAGARTALG